MMQDSSWIVAVYGVAELAEKYRYVLITFDGSLYHVALDRNAAADDNSVWIDFPASTLLHAMELAIDFDARFPREH